MDGSVVAGVLWLLAAVTSAAATLVFRDDSFWYAITLVASGLAVVVGILLLRRSTSGTIWASSILGVAWVAMYVILVVDQIDDFGAWSGNVFFALLGAAASIYAYTAERQTSRRLSSSGGLAA